MKANKNNYYAYNKNLKNRARSLRSKGTKAEAYLWKFVLRARQMKGYQFRRQRPVLNYIADFMCKELSLIIEVDGSIHQLEEVKARDNKREQDLKEAGFHILRFENEAVIKNTNGVYREIEDWIEGRP